MDNKIFTDFEDYKKKRFKECPELKEEYDRLQLERKIVAQVIKLRKKKNITQEQLALLANTKQPNIARFESGELSPSIGFLKRIADVLDSDIDVRFIPKAKVKVGS